MSAPTSSFSKLSLSQEMQAPRGHGRGQSGGKMKGKEPTPQDDPESGSDDGSEDFWADHVIALDHCRQFDSPKDANQRRYAFQIAYAEVESYSIRISTDEGVRCSCGEEGTCHHVSWLLAQIARTKEDAEGVDSGLYKHISDLGLENVCEDLDWELRQGSESEETKWQLKKDYQSSKLGRQTRSMVRARMEVVRDIMAALSPEITDSYRPDIFESPDDVTEDGILVEGDLEATVARLLILDDVLFYKFRSLVSRNLRATEYFRKMGLKAEETFHLLQKYEDRGPLPGQAKNDLAWCAQTLVNIVDTIGNNVTMRQPLSPLPREEAAKSLVAILKDVVKNHNYDHYQSVTWPRRVPHGERQIDRNLYERLIGSTSRSNPSGGNFVIKALQDLPEAQRFVDDLQETLECLEGIGWGPAPQAYRDRLSALIAQLKSVSGPSSTAYGKRPASGMDRAAKRMK
ncbi:hypothetical protein D0Z07_2754 [Hyphodiscus hymeniophilus]|uniref:SWIM-type domain-containing protein n=1 Tax=Hyphodiscus hymeniophilus TaxID=353542 RepID=A0A9P6VNH2_9HELO|nr:hypothetical protein D0Z07_2754 [Hyphodiscus hymeniophilus]